jgi:hypothetical protein
MTAAVDQRESGPGWVHGRVGNVVFLIFHSCVSEDGITHSFEVIGRTLARHPSGIALVAIFGERTQVPSAATRRRILSYMGGIAKQLLIGGTVIEGDSVGATVKRVATSMMTTIISPQFAHKTVRSVPLACDYVARCAVDDQGAPLSQGALFLAATGLRSTMPSEPVLSM